MERDGAPARRQPLEPTTRERKWAKMERRMGRRTRGWRWCFVDSSWTRGKQIFKDQGDMVLERSRRGEEPGLRVGSQSAGEVL